MGGGARRHERMRDAGAGLRAAAERVERCADETTLVETLTLELAPFGIEHWIYITVATDGDPPILISTLDLHEEMVEERPFDPFLEYCCEHYDITRTGVEHMLDYPYLNDRDRAFIARAGAMGFRSGVGIPVRLVGSPVHGGFNLGTRLDRDSFDRRIMPLVEPLRAFCLIAHRRVQELAADAASDPGQGSRAASGILSELTPRETTVLAGLASGESRRASARRLGISEHTVATHIRNIYGKMGVQNRVEATKLAIAEGLVA